MSKVTRRAALAAALLLPAGCAGRQPRYSFTFEEIDGRIVFPLKVSGMAGKALLDNGSMSILDRDLESVTKTQGSLALFGPLGRGKGQHRRQLKVNDTDVVQLYGVPVEVGGMRLITDPLVGGVTAWHKQLIFVLGYELFRRYIVGVDYDSHTLNLHDRYEFFAPPQFRRIDLHPDPRQTDKWLVDLDLGLDAPVRALVDLGTSTALCVSSDLADRLDLKVLFKRRWAHLIDSGGVEVSVATTPSLKIGDFTLANVTTEIFPSKPPVQWEFDAVIGAPLLGRFKFYFDHVLGRMWIAPAKRMGRPFLHSNSGFLTFWRRKEKQMDTVDVSPGGPADRAGLKTGDVIIAIDGRALDPAFVQAWLAKDHTTIDLTLANGRKLTVTLEDYADRY